MNRLALSSVVAAVALVATAGLGLSAQAPARGRAAGPPPVPYVGPDPNAHPNPYHLVENWAPVTATTSTPPTWPERQVVGIHFDQTTGNMLLLQRANPPILVLDPTGRTLIRGYGDGLFVEPHGWDFMADGSVWVADVSARDGSGLTVVKLAPDGTVLTTIGTKGVAGSDPEHFIGPTGVVVGDNGDVFVSDGHRGAGVHRIARFDKNGTFIKSWGTTGAGPGQFSVPHGIAIDSRGRLFVSDRGNNRIQIFDQDGTLLDTWRQFGRPETILITADDTIYVADTQSNSRNNPRFRRGVRIGSARDGTVTAFIPDPEPNPDATQTSAAVALAVDGQGSVYTAEVWSNANVGMARMVKKFEKR
ncbi:MAG: 6-bladed beta-propeller [Vicinamibacterales bacterium]